MLNGMQMAIVGKDIRAIASNSRMLAAVIAMPLVLTVILPLVMMLPVSFASPGSQALRQFSGMLGAGAHGAMSTDDLRRAILELIFNRVMPMIFLVLPVVASGVMAAGSFVGEKDRGTMETLLYCPLSLGKIFAAKIMASFFVGFGVAVASFAAMALAVMVGVSAAAGFRIAPDANWLVVMLLVSPSMSLIAIGLVVRASAKARSSEEAYARSLLLVIPVAMLALGQFHGFLAMDIRAFLAAGAALAAAAALMLRVSSRKFRHEALLH